MVEKKSAEITMQKNQLIKILVLFLGSFISLTCLAEEDAEQREKLNVLKKSIEELKRDLRAAKSNRDALLTDLESTEKKVGELSEKAEKLKNELQQQNQKIDDLNDERSDLNEKKSFQQTQVGQYIHSAYRLGNQSNVRLLLNQQDPTRVSRNLKYYDYFVRARTEKITEYLSTIERIDEIKPEIEYHASQIKKNVTSLNQKRAQLRQAQDSRQATLAKLNLNIQSQDEQLVSMQKDRSRLEKLLQRVGDFIRDTEFVSSKNNFRSLKGKLPWPTAGTLARSFGSSRVSNKLRWQGILINSNPGEPVMAVHHGQVVFSDYLRGHGLLIIVDHGTGYMSLYAHNQALYKELGEWVDSGETIASVGDSGGLKKSALYFELRHKGVPINPKNWFKQA